MTRHKKSHHTKWHDMTRHDMTWHHLTSHHIASHHMAFTWHDILQLTTLPHPSQHNQPQYFISPRSLLPQARPGTICIICKYKHIIPLRSQLRCVLGHLSVCQQWVPSSPGATDYSNGCVCASLHCGWHFWCNWICFPLHLPEKFQGPQSRNMKIFPLIPILIPGLATLGGALVAPRCGCHRVVQHNLPPTNPSIWNAKELVHVQLFVGGDA